MEKEFDSPEEALTQDVNVASGEGNRADAQKVGQDEVLSRINKELNRNYPSFDEAIKGMRETQKYVGKVGKVLPIVDKLSQKFGSESVAYEKMEELTKDQTQSDYVTRDELFFRDHPEYGNSEIRPLVESLKSTTGKSIQEVVEMDSVKTVVGKLKAYDEVERSKSVLVSNPRLGQARDVVTEAKAEMRASPTSEVRPEVREKVVESVIQAYDLR